MKYLLIVTMIKNPYELLVQLLFFKIPVLIGTEKKCGKYFSVIMYIIVIPPLHLLLPR